jgi:hypothetical protein
VPCSCASAAKLAVLTGSFSLGFTGSFAALLIGLLENSSVKYFGMVDRTLPNDLGFRQCLFGNGAGGPLMRFGPSRTGRDSCVFSLLVSSRQPQFLFLSVPFLSESKGLAKDAPKPRKSEH